jgi:hypothetical protein
MSCERSFLSASLNFSVKSSILSSGSAGNPEAQVGSTDPSSLIEQADPQQVIALLRALSADKIVWWKAPSGAMGMWLSGAYHRSVNTSI